MTTITTEKIEELISELYNFYGLEHWITIKGVKQPSSFDLSRSPLISRAIEMLRAYASQLALPAGPVPEGAEIRNAALEVQALSEEVIENFTNHVIQKISEYDDRSSPEDQPEMLLVTADELGDEIRAAFREYASQFKLPPLPVAAISRLAATPSEWNDMTTAPRDGTLVRLLVRFTEHSTEDEPEAPTIGANSFDNTGVDEWLFAGWSWEQDCFTQGEGEPIGWLPLLDAPAVAQPVEDEQDAARLDWIDAQGSDFNHGIVLGMHFIKGKSGKQFHGRRFRIAIDAARAALCQPAEAKPTDCSGDPQCCPQNEGHGCDCSQQQKGGA